MHLAACDRALRRSAGADSTTLAPQ
jgi:hypothetical protein